MCKERRIILKLECAKSIIESILFAAGRVVKISELATILEMTPEEVIDTIELGNKLKRKQGRFEAYHTYVLDNPIREEEIESYALERHGKSIESMTKQMNISKDIIQAMKVVVPI